MADLRSFLLIAVSITVFLMTSACRSKSLSPESPSPGSSSTQTSDPNSVSFKLQEMGRRKVKEGEEVTWRAIHESSAGAARFQIILILQPPGGDSPFVISTGAFIRDTDSHYSEFLRQVAKALEAKSIKARKSKIDRLDFTIALLGQNLSRVAMGKAGGLTSDAFEQPPSQGQSQGNKTLAGGFTSEPPGDWIATKVFVADGAGEFFLNVNSKESRGEISIKDPEYGNVVLRELSRVF